MSARIRLAILAAPLALAAMDSSFPRDEFEVVVGHEMPVSERFSVAGIEGTWDQAHRGVVEVRGRNRPGLSPWIGWGGFQAAYEQRDGSFDQGGTISADTVLLGLIGGGEYRFIDGDGFRLGGELGGRFSAGFQDGAVTDVTIASGRTGSAALPGMRYEAAAGPALVGRVGRVGITLGTNVTWFFSAESTMISAGGGGGSVAVSGQYAGYEIGTHLGLSIRL